MLIRALLLSACAVGSVRAGGSCVAAGPSALSVTLSSPSGLATELQLCAGDAGCQPQLALTFHKRDAAALHVSRLVPETTYQLWTRTLDKDDVWSRRERCCSCRTEPLAPGQVGLVQLHAAPTSTTLDLSWRLPTPGSRGHTVYTVEWWQSNHSGADDGPEIVPVRDPPPRAALQHQIGFPTPPHLNHRLLLQALRPATQYAVRVRAHDAPPRGRTWPWSPVEHFRTLPHGVVATGVLRVTDFCPNGGCEGPDQLGDANTADVGGVAWLLTNSRYILSLDKRPDPPPSSPRRAPFPNASLATISHRCVQWRAAGVVPQYGEYLSCNSRCFGWLRAMRRKKDPLMYNLIDESKPECWRGACECALATDRVIARRDTARCDRTYPRDFPLFTCGCDGDERAARRAVGRMEVVDPPPVIQRTRLAPDAGADAATRAARKGIEFLQEFVPLANATDRVVGHWYSHPKAAQCAPGQRPSARGCAWRAHTTAHFISGADLLAHGWIDPRHPTAVLHGQRLGRPATRAELYTNVQVLRERLAAARKLAASTVRVRGDDDVCLWGRHFNAGSKARFRKQASGLQRQAAPWKIGGQRW